jgi:hypothetical protein
MSRQFYGVGSLALVGVATVLAAIAMFSASVVLGVIYLVICVAASNAVIRAFCAKCACKAHCGHVFPGRLAQRVARPAAPYTAAEWTTLGVAMLALMGLPQLWLWQMPGLFVTYWVLTGIAVIEIRQVMCRGCANTFCPLRAASRHAD